MRPIDKSSEAIRELKRIKWLLVATVAIGLLLTASIVAGVASVYYVSQSFAEHAQPASFRDKADALLKENKLPELKALAEERLGEHPNDENAEWYLALYYYHAKEWDKALEHLEQVRFLAPSWEQEHVEPYAKIARERLKRNKRR